MVNTENESDDIDELYSSLGFGNLIWKGHFYRHVIKIKQN